jgi:hypothetical protein
MPKWRGNAVSAGGIPVKNMLHLQAEWFPVVGEIVEIRLYDNTVRTGRVDGVTPDDQILWIASDGADPRALFERSHAYSVWIEYKWETASAVRKKIHGPPQSCSSKRPRS